MLELCHIKKTYSIWIIFKLIIYCYFHQVLFNNIINFIIGKIFN